MDWLLTDEEIGKAKEDSYEMLPKFCDNWTPGELRQWEDNAIARAAAQNVAKWLFSPCKEHHLNNSTPPLRIDCYICRKNFEQEVGY